MSKAEPVLLKEKHVKYWLRCAKTFLPERYTNMDSNRISLGFFIVAALDLLDILESKCTETERHDWVDWLYACQLDSGGFRGFPGSKFAERNVSNQHWDPANVPATFFALMTLLVLGDDLSRVRRSECLDWLPRLQRPDGSFGETLGDEGRIEGGSDLRFCCCAAGVRYILRGRQREVGKTDIDVERLSAHISACQTYDGGFSKGPGHESHSGLTYCAIAAFAFLSKASQRDEEPSLIDEPPPISVLDCIAWMSSRQTIEDTEPESPNPASPSDEADPDPSSPTKQDEQNLISFTADNLRCAGFNGRTNKIADTCYAFWNAGALTMLGHLDIIDKARTRRFLLEKTQHLVGGFGKNVGDLPDILHSYLGLTALALLGDESLLEFDPTFCTTVRSRKRLKSVSWWK